jgi:hypothetical protein
MNPYQQMAQTRPPATGPPTTPERPDAGYRPEHGPDSPAPPGHELVRERHNQASPHTTQGKYEFKAALERRTKLNKRNTYRLSGGDEISTALCIQTIQDVNKPDYVAMFAQVEDRGNESIKDIANDIEGLQGASKETWTSLKISIMTHLYGARYVDKVHKRVEDIVHQGRKSFEEYTEKGTKILKGLTMVHECGGSNNIEKLRVRTNFISQWIKGLNNADGKHVMQVEYERSIEMGTPKTWAEMLQMARLHSSIAQENGRSTDNNSNDRKRGDKRAITELTTRMEAQQAEYSNRQRKMHKRHIEEQESRHVQHKNAAAASLTSINTAATGTRKEHAQATAEYRHQKDQTMHMMAQAMSALPAAMSTPPIAAPAAPPTQQAPTAPTMPMLPPPYPKQPQHNGVRHGDHRQGDHRQSDHRQDDRRAPSPQDRQRANKVLSPEAIKRIAGGLCFRCGKDDGHQARNCPHDRCPHCKGYNHHEKDCKLHFTYERPRPTDRDGRSGNEIARR